MVTETKAKSAPDPKAIPAVLQVMPRLTVDCEFGPMRSLAEGLVEHGWRVIFAAGETDQERLLEAIGARFIRLPLASRNPLTIWLNTRRLTRLIREHRVRLVHGHESHSAWSAAIASRRGDASFLTTVHRWPKVNSGIARRYAAVMTGGDRVVVGSEAMGEALEKDGLIEASRLRIIRNGVDFASFDPAVVRGHRMAALSERWQLSLDHKVVLLPGPVDTNSNAILMLEAMSRSERRDWLLLLVGEHRANTSYVRRLERFILEHKLSDRVVFGGQCQDMPAAMMMADVIALPALDDTIAYTFAVQAQAMGKPVIVSNSGCLPEAIMPAATGWLVPTGDAAKVIWALDLALDLVEDVKLRVAERARAFVAEQFGMAQMIQRTHDLYRELVRDAPAKPSRSGASDGDAEPAA